MPEQRPDHGQGQAPSGADAGEGMTEVMKPDAFKPRLGPYPVPGLAEVDQRLVGVAAGRRLPL